MTTEPVVAEAEAIAAPVAVQARRIGFLGDDHNAHDDGSELPDEVFEAFADVDLVVHLGHMGFRELLGRGVLDRLGKVAPVLAVRDYSGGSDGKLFVTPADGERVAGLTRVVEAGGVRIGAVHNPSRPPGPSITTPPAGLPELAGVDVPEAVAAKFGGAVDVVAYASTHRPAAILAGGVLFVNPGSPTYPKGPGRVAGEGSLGTVGVLEVDDGVAAFEVIELSAIAKTSGTGDS
jgi:uncharacterized protein